MTKITINKFAAKKIRQGISVLDVRDFSHENYADGFAALYVDKTFLTNAYFSRQNKGVGWTIETTDFVQLFKTAKAKRQNYFNDELTTAFRIFNQDGDGFGGMTVDIYGNFALFSWYNSFIYSLKADILNAFRQVFPEILGGYEKVRFESKLPISSHIFGETSPDKLTILENGVKYQVFLNDGLMTGIFLDQHEVRGALLDELAVGKDVLNLFSYTAAFSVAAAMGGAVSTVSVDLAKRSRELSEAHFKANGLALENHKFHVMDVFEYFKYAARKNLTFDLIVIDPPSFARNKKMTFSVAKNYHQLIADSLPILNKYGKIIASTNHAGLTREAFLTELSKGFGTQKFDIIKEFSLPADFVTNPCDPHSDYLKVFVLEIKT
ncbi:SAM-dependent methyltransferase [Lactococcus hodotermopsidis]|uniref:SAM-dependent methyltransferase n=1 Tax=Pseudolactococcus hodotermopsidis TaxID=2709157 RepID=A0A6A0BF47_9LACT|nr:class I SAM-dependent rRNA methyltransferase [Lactococcus hodotermopsidis]GFH43074.1 SAM-dependent methyltransferase [Lactococcus hodotermopsidis]